MSYYHDDGAWGNDGDGDSGADNGMREGDLSGGYSDYDGDARGPSWDAGGVYEDHSVRQAIARSIGMGPQGDIASYMVDSASEPTAQDEADEREYAAEQRRLWGFNALHEAHADPDGLWTPETPLDGALVAELTRRQFEGDALKTKTTTRKSGAVKMDELEAARLNYDRAARDLSEAEARATRFGAEPDLGVVVTFRKTYSLPSRSANRNRVYNYAAIRAQNGWNLTGRETGTKTWVELNEFADDATLRVATGWDTDPTTAVTSNVGHGFDGQGNGFLAFQMPVPDTSLLVGQLPPSGTRYEVSTTLSVDPANADDENTDMITMAVVMEEITVLGHVVARRPVKQFASGEDYSSEQAEAAAQDFAEKLNERNELASHLTGVTPVTER